MTAARTTSLPGGQETLAAAPRVCHWLDHPAPELVARIAAAADLAALVAAAGECGGIGRALVAADAGPGLVSRIVSQLNDAVAQRAIELTARRHRLPPARWCWLAFGSEGRSEQTFVTDQDNGLIFSAADGAEAKELRSLFLPFAADVNQALAACGFPLCSGGIMAGNPAWCLSLDEWRHCFATWIRTPDPTALLNATIFFDFRPLHGDAALAQALGDALLAMTRSNAAFLRMMAANALSVAPPLGLLGDVVGSDDAEGRVDLKKLGSRLFVDGARILALAAGCAEANTVTRLRAAGGRDAEANVQAYYGLMRLRLAGQSQRLAAGETPGNLFLPAELNEFDQRLLKEALRQARFLQSQLKHSFSIET